MNKNVGTNLESIQQKNYKSKIRLCSQIKRLKFVQIVIDLLLNLK